MKVFDEAVHGTYGNSMSHLAIGSIPIKILN